MKYRRLIKTISIVLCFLLICAPLMSCQDEENTFYRGAKKYLKKKYDVKCESLIYHESPMSGFNAAEFGIVELENGERVIVSLADGNYADSYELLELYDAWMKELSKELGATVVMASIKSGSTITYNNGERQERTLGTFLETSEKRYNASNVDEFIDDYYDFADIKEVYFYIEKTNPTDEWVEDLAGKLAAFKKKAGAKIIEADVYASYKPLWLQLYPDDYLHVQSGDGREYQVRCDFSSYSRYDTHEFYNDTICISLINFK